MNINELEIEDVETSDIHYMERLEELRRVLESILKKDVLSTLLELYKELDKGPEQFHYFLESSIHGLDCKYAKAVLFKFEKERLVKVRELLKECLAKIPEGL